MNIIKNILVPVDFSPSANNAINYVQGLAKNDRRVKFTLLNCISDDSARTLSTEQLDNVKKKYFDDENIACETVIMTGKLHTCVSSIMTTSKMDMIIMGTSGQVDENHPSKTVDLIEHVDCPVWVIPKNATHFNLNNIALALDEKELDEAADLSVFHDIAKWHNTKVHLLKVDPEGSKREKLDLRKEYTLEYYLDNLDYHYSFPKNSDIEQGIYNYIEENKIDTLAIIPRMHAKNSTPSKGNLTKALVSYCKFPLLIID